MAEMFDYLRWRGDIPFSQVRVNNVDSLIFSVLAYVHFDGFVSGEINDPIPLRDVVRDMLMLPHLKDRVRVEHDVELLKAAAATERFGAVGVTFYQSTFIPQEETQFAAVTFLLDDGTAFLAFRGTDNTLVGWKEDFNMTFQESVPAQRLAREYVEYFASHSSAPLRLGGHSKGGNLAVYAGAKSELAVQDRILGVYNHDGPGFTQQMMTDPGYLRIVTKVKTFVPQSSVIGMLLEHEEPYTVIHSKSISVWQHDLYSWELMGKHLLTMDALTEDSVFLDATIKNWFASMTNQERNQLVDAVYALVSASGADRPADILQMKNIKSYIRTISSDERLRKMLGAEFAGLIASARKAMTQLESARQDQKRLEEKNE